jgi:hypothetical protein
LAGVWKKLLLLAVLFRNLGLSDTSPIDFIKEYRGTAVENPLSKLLPTPSYLLKEYGFC